MHQTFKKRTTNTQTGNIIAFPVWIILFHVSRSREVEKIIPLPNGKYLVNKTATGNRSGAGREVVLNCLGPLSTVIEQTGILGSFLMVIEGEESPV